MIAHMPGAAIRALALIVTLAAAAAAAGCGDEAERAPAVDAQESNEVTLGSLHYRVVTFRELNGAITPDQSLINDVRSAEDHGLFAAFLEVCNRGEQPQTPTDRMHLEDAFGAAYQPLEQGLDPALVYQPRQLAPGVCVPAEGSLAADTFDGAAAVFELPYDIAQQRPVILAIRAANNEDARIVLDL